MAEVVTLTMNPALDLSAQVERLEPAHKLRCEQPLWHPGGGGINVARVLHRLGLGVLAVFPAGGGTGQRLCRLLQDEGVPMQCLPIDAETRENFQVTERATGREYRFVMPGPALSQAQWEQALHELAGVQPRPACIVASGGLAPGMPADFLARVVRWARGAGVRVALDCWGEPLRLALAEGVWVVKPSLRELEEFFGRPLPDEAAQVAAARELVATGRAQVVALSLGESGALLATAQGVWIAPALQVQVAGTVGAGDSFMAGLLASLLRKDDPAAALRMAMAAAGSALTTAGTGLSQPGQVARLVEQVELRSL